MINIENNFPKEYLIELKSLSPHLVGRITVFQDEKKFNLEIDIIQVESGKIYNHVKSLYGEDEIQDALAQAVQVLNNFLQAKLH